MSDITKARVVYVRNGASLWRRDGSTWRGIGHTGTISPLDMMHYRTDVSVVVDEDGNVVADLDTLSVFDGDARDLLAEFISPTHPVSVSVDRDLSAAYLRFSDAPVARTVTDVRYSLAVDIDAAGNLVGIETLAEIPDEALEVLEKLT